MNRVASIDWCYLTLRNGYLYNEDNTLYTEVSVRFTSLEQAEQWLIDNDCRATII